MAKSHPHAALQRYDEEHITLQNQIKSSVVTFLEINSCEKIILFLVKISYVSAGRDRKRDCRAYSWWIALLCIRIYSLMTELNSEPGNHGDSTEGYGIKAQRLWN